MLTYFRGAGCSLFVASILLYFYVVSREGVVPVDDSGTYYILQGYIIVLNFVGALFGLALYLNLSRKKSHNVLLNIVLFALLGLAYSIVLSFLLPFKMITFGITICGSIFFYLAQLSTKRTASYTTAIGGLVVSISIFLLLYFVY